jgi:hypothetical protein
VGKSRVKKIMMVKLIIQKKRKEKERNRPGMPTT